MTPREPAHLLQPLDRHERGERLALALDDELVAAQRDPAEQVADPCRTSRVDTLSGMSLIRCGHICAQEHTKDSSVPGGARHAFSVTAIPACRQG
jgi:hypothetical protein